MSVTRLDSGLPRGNSGCAGYEKNQADVAIIAEPLAADLLIRHVLNGVLDIRFMLEPAPLEVLIFEEVAVIQLVLVSTWPEINAEAALADDLMVHWGLTPREHSRKFSHGGNGLDVGNPVDEQRYHAFSKDSQPYRTGAPFSSSRANRISIGVCRRLIHQKNSPSLTISVKYIMKIAILSRNRKLYSTRRLIESGTQRGHEITVLDSLKCNIDIASHRPSIWYKGEKLGAYDAVIPRIGASVTAYGSAVLRQFEMAGSYPVNESVAIVRSRDKLRSLQILARAGIGLPLTAFASSPDSTKELIKIVGGAPLVVKLTESTQGKGVILAETEKAAESLIDAFREMKATFLIQEYIKEASGADIRCLVVGDKVVGSMLRQAKDGEFRSNLHRGGTASVVRITPEERSTAVRAAKKMGLNVSGVDILRSNHGPVVLEVNSSPGLEGIERATRKDITTYIYGFIEKNAKPNRTRTRGHG